MVAPRAEKAYEKYAWVLLLALGVLELVIGLGLVFFITPADYQSQRFTSLTWGDLVASNPGAANFVIFLMRVEGVMTFGFSILAIAISLKSFRRSEKWAWWAMWSWPVIFLGSILVGWLGPAVGAAQITLALLGLFLPYRKFFPRKP